jgi:hypothetical protein
MVVCARCPCTVPHIAALHFNKLIDRHITVVRALLQIKDPCKSHTRIPPNIQTPNISSQSSPHLPPNLIRSLPRPNLPKQPQALQNIHKLKQHRITAPRRRKRHRNSLPLLYPCRRTSVPHLSNRHYDLRKARERRFHAVVDASHEGEGCLVVFHRAGWEV